ncbi:tRNA-dependent cyclodipeptide synthase [Mycobacterium heidelbergense]|uniref:tRNA-dependent cyclodipeptide synthase n=1 Tax=Mycobacterium heidelbergense TaxID=53376 RepID=UPI003CF3AE6E
MAAVDGAATSQHSPATGWSLNTNGLIARPCTAHCGEILQRRDHVLVGLSPGNSYFSVDRITRMAQWACTHFNGMHFFTWEEPHAWSLYAVGLPWEKAKKHANKNYRNVLNKARKALWAAGIEDPDSRILTWPKLKKIPAYRELRGNVYELFDRDAGFRDSCLTETRRYLAAQPLLGDLSFEARTTIAVRYYLEEIPLFVDTPRLVGANSSVYCYHQLSPFRQQLYQHKLSVKPAPGQACVTLEDEQSGQPARLHACADVESVADSVN